LKAKTLNNIVTKVPIVKNRTATKLGNFEIKGIPTMNVVVNMAIAATIHAIKNDKDIKANFIIFVREELSSPDIIISLYLNIMGAEYKKDTSPFIATRIHHFIQKITDPSTTYKLASVLT
jgi:hypothetical protein